MIAFCSMPKPMDADRQRLLEAKLEEMPAWSPPEIEKTVGPYDPTEFEPYMQFRERIVERCRQRLADYSNEEITLLLERSIACPSDTPSDPDDPTAVAFWNDWASFARADMAKAGKQPPPWYAAGFGHPDYRADFDYWAKMRNFSVSEITCLSIGIKPDLFPPKRLKDLEAKQKDGLYPSLDFLVMRHQQLARQFDPGSNGWRVEPDRFLKWVDQFEFETHPEFLRLLQRYHRKSDAEAGPVNDDKPDRREVNSIAQLFTAMAIEYFGYRPDEKKSPATGEIQNLADSLGLSISDDTIRKYLKLGAKEVSKDWEPNKR